MNDTDLQRFTSVICHVLSRSDFMPVKLNRNTPLNSTVFRCKPLICNLNKIYRLEFQARNSGLEIGSQFELLLNFPKYILARPSVQSSERH